MANPRKNATNWNTVQMDGTAETINSIAITTLQADNNGNILMATGATLPTAGSSGYTQGGWFILTGVTAGEQSLYVNGGSATSSAFVASGGGILTKQVSISSADILALNATPKELIAAPGSGKVIKVLGITLKMVTTATQYANGGALEFRYTDGSGAKVTADIAAAVVTAAAATSYTSVAGVTTSLTNVANAAIVVDNATAAFITGTGTAVATLTYQIVTP